MPTRGESCTALKMSDAVIASSLPIPFPLVSLSSRLAMFPVSLLSALQAPATALPSLIAAPVRQVSLLATSATSGAPGYTAGLPRTWRRRNVEAWCMLH